jgi:hypothetical protein
MNLRHRLARLEKQAEAREQQHRPRDVFGRMQEYEQFLAGGPYPSMLPCPQERNPGQWESEYRTEKAIAKAVRAGVLPWQLPEDLTDRERQEAERFLDLILQVAREQAQAGVMPEGCDARMLCLPDLPEALVKG